MLLAKKANAIENLSGTRPRCLEPLAKLGIFQLETLDSFGSELGASGRSIDRFHPRLGLQGTPAKAAQLFTKVVDKAL
jgi:hypothetical protein